MDSHCNVHSQIKLLFIYLKGRENKTQGKSFLPVTYSLDPLPQPRGTQGFEPSPGGSITCWLHHLLAPSIPIIRNVKSKVEPGLELKHPCIGCISPKQELNFYQPLFLPKSYDSLENFSLHVIYVDSSK